MSMPATKAITTLGIFRRSIATSSCKKKPKGHGNREAWRDTKRQPTTRRTRRPPAVQRRSACPDRRLDLFEAARVSLMPGPCGIELALVRTVAPCSAQPVSAVEVFPDRVLFNLLIAPASIRRLVHAPAQGCFMLAAVALATVSVFGNPPLAPG